LLLSLKAVVFPRGDVFDFLVGGDLKGVADALLFAEGGDLAVGEEALLEEGDLARGEVRVAAADVELTAIVAFAALPLAFFLGTGSLTGAAPACFAFFFFELTGGALLFFDSLAVEALVDLVEPAAFAWSADAPASVAVEASLRLMPADGALLSSKSTTSRFLGGFLPRGILTIAYS
jgi:hypothetical protein